jgi:hypothetical protein
MRSAKMGGMQHLIDRLLTYPLVPGGMLLCWLVLELLALRRLRRGRLE